MTGDDIEHGAPVDPLHALCSLHMYCFSILLKTFLKWGSRSTHGLLGRSRRDSANWRAVKEREKKNESKSCCYTILAKSFSITQMTYHNLICLSRLSNFLPLVCHAISGFSLHIAAKLLKICWLVC